LRRRTNSAEHSKCSFGNCLVPVQNSVWIRSTKLVGLLISDSFICRHYRAAPGPSANLNVCCEDGLAVHTFRRPADHELDRLRLSVFVPMSRPISALSTSPRSQLPDYYLA
jgi:hypothetical protein